MEINDKKRVLVLGLGKTGFSCLRYLDRICRVTVLDSRAEPPYKTQVESGSFRANCRFGDLSLTLSELSEFDLVIKSPGLAKDAEIFDLIEQLSIPVWGDLDIFALAANKPIVAITGSNGKTTVTDMLGFVINEFTDKKALVGGNIGTPVLDLLLSDAEPDFYILELSSFQIETLNHFKVEVATVLNVSDDHLDRYSSFEAYRDVKLSLFDRAKHIVVNTDKTANYTLEYQREIDSTFWLDSGHPVDSKHSVTVEAGKMTVDGHPLFLTTELKIKGKHNLLNALAVMAIGQILGLKCKELEKGILAYSGLPHRCQWVGSNDGVDYINDSKATNVGATIAALEGVSKGENLVWILGGEGKGADFSPLVPAAKNRVKQAYCYGKDGLQLHTLMSPHIKSELVPSLQEAVSKAKTIAKKGDIILLSPACASLDMFPSFEARGEAFVTALGEAL